MPYASIEELPAPVRSHLPIHAQQIYRSAFNHAWESHADDPAREEIAHRIAWAAVKRSYRKLGADWVPIG
jgi:cation transport regulator